MNKRCLFSILTLCVSLNYICAQTFTIADGVTVETSYGVYIELAGNLVETGTGYLKGIVTSGDRTGVQSFAGLTLSTGMDGTITRKTGSAYAGGHGEGTNMLRYYELNNTGSAITPNVSAAYVASGTHDEENGLSGPYFIYNYDDPNWGAYGDGVTATPISGNTVAIAAGANDLVFSEGIKINSKFYLEGPYDDGTNVMLTTINGSIPTTSPYTEDARTASAVPAAAVDWVLVEVRATTGGAALGYRSCFLKSDGRLIGDNGSNNIGLPWIPGSYFIVMRHRNHHGVMTAATQTGLTWGGSPTTYDYSTAQTQAYTGGADPMVLVDTAPGNVYGCYAGETNNSGIITNSDKDLINTDLNNSGYYVSDTNMSEIVTNADKDPVNSNLNKSAQIP